MNAILDSIPVNNFYSSVSHCLFSNSVIHLSKHRSFATVITIHCSWVMKEQWPVNNRCDLPWIYSGLTGCFFDHFWSISSQLFFYPDNVLSNIFLCSDKNTGQYFTVTTAAQSYSVLWAMKQTSDLWSISPLFFF